MSYYSSGEEWEMVPFRREVYEYYLFQKIQEELGESNHPLIVVGKQLSGEFLAEKLVGAFTDRRVYMRCTVLELVGALNGKILSDGIGKLVVAALEDENKVVRVAAMKCVGKLIQQGVVEGVVPAIIKRVADDEVEIQEKAWQVLESSKRRLGVWT